MDPYTACVISATGSNASPRVRQVFASLVSHLHNFLRENKVTVDEWILGVDLINRIGQMSDTKRNEGILVCDVLGVESLVDAITYDLETESHTKSCIIGPPIEGAKVEVWHTAPNGLYEQQDPEQPEYNLRGTFYTDKDGVYEFVGLRPTSYPIPFDGPAGDILRLLDRYPFRPGHIHFLVSSPGHRRLVTQIFDSNDAYVENDSVFAVKNELIVEFLPCKSGKAQFEVEYDIVLPTDEEVSRMDEKKVSIEQR
ncbi:Intradiol ring-cleavage dioxygenase [Lipomyces starkeyi]